MTPVQLAPCGIIVALALVLLSAAWSKRRSDPRLAAVEVAAALAGVLAPTPAGAGLETVLFVGFAGHHARAWRTHAPSCGCFGEQPTRTGARPTALTSAAALLAGFATVATAASPASAAIHHPAQFVVVLAAGGVTALAWRAAFTAPDTAMVPRTSPLEPARLADGAARWLERRTTRRTVLHRVALTGTALAVAPVRYLLYPVSALAAVVPGDCAGGECTDGYTAFCCQIHHGLNTCPTGTFPGGWWMCTDYSGRRLCTEEGIRYYVDCNALPGHPFPGGCRCANDTCDEQRVACNIFRYGQCNTQIAGTTAVVCRMVVCENPSQIEHLHCSASLAVDDAVCGQDTPCLEPMATETAAAGGV